MARASTVLCVAGVAAFFSPAPTAAADTPSRPDNVVLMIADGAGFNAWQATAMYQGEPMTRLFDGPEWVRLAASTYALRQDEEIPVSPDQGSVQLPSLVYDPVRAWDTTPVTGEEDGFPYHFAGYRWLHETRPDSANTVTTLFTGRKTYSGAINYDGERQPIGDTLAALAVGAGKANGVVTTVQFSHATPAAAAGAHNASRRRYCSLAVEMLTDPDLDLIVGAGNPGFDNNGIPIADAGRREYRFVGGENVWARLEGAGALSAGDKVCEPYEGEAAVLSEQQAAVLGSWTLLQSRSEIETQLEGDTPDKLLIVPQVGQIGFATGIENDTEWIGGTLQQARGSRADPRYTAPGDDPLLAGVPALETLTRVALNALDDAPRGFFLHVEGGAVDWAMHSRQTGRMIEEMLDFERAVAAVVDWIERHGGWERTLLIVTADHDHLFWGPHADKIPFEPLKDNGAGKLPGLRWLSEAHSNALVPLFARGPGAEGFYGRALKEDPFRGSYVDQADIYEVVKAGLSDRATGPAGRR